jgi:hypothetical protein
LTLKRVQGDRKRLFQRFCNPSEGVKKLKAFSDYTFLSLRLDKSLAWGKKYLTKYLICNNIIQYEESGSKESKFTEEDPGLF